MTEDIALLCSVPHQLVHRFRELHRPEHCWFCTPDYTQPITVHVGRFSTSHCPSASNQIEALLRLYVAGAWNL